MTLDQAIHKLRELNEPVPKPTRLPAESEVAQVERDLGVKFHPDYRRFLLESSDVVFGNMEPATITDADSHTHLPAICESAWDEMEVPRKLLPICEDNGDYYCMNARGQVVFWSADGATDEKWPDLATWIEQVWIAESGDEGDEGDEDDEDDDDDDA
jgi:hypothetical protein